MTGPDKNKFPKFNYHVTKTNLWSLETYDHMKNGLYDFILFILRMVLR